MAISTTKRFARRHFLGASAAAVGLAPAAAAQTPDVTYDTDRLRIKEVKVYVTATGRLASILTESGTEGICTLQTRIFHADWDNRGWLDYARRTLVGKNVLDRAQLTSQFHPSRRHFGQSPYAAGIDVCLWDALGKAAGLPVYRVIGAHKDRLPAFASSQHFQTKTPEPYVDAALKAKAEGFRAFKINAPPVAQGGDTHYRLDMEICAAVRKAVGDEFTLMFDPVGNYTRREAMEVGLLLDRLNFHSFMDPLPSTDLDGLAQLSAELRLPLVIGEFFSTLYSYPEFVKRGSADILRFVTDNVGGITGGLKIGTLAELHGMEIMPHGVGSVMHQAAHLHCCLAMPNSAFVEVPYPQGARDAQPYMVDTIRIGADGYVHAPTKPGLGYEVDRNKLESAITQIER